MDHTQGVMAITSSSNRSNWWLAICAVMALISPITCQTSSSQFITEFGSTVLLSTTPQSINHSSIDSSTATTIETSPQSNIEPTTTRPQSVPQSTTAADTSPPQSVPESTTNTALTTPQTVPQSTPRATATTTKSAPLSTTKHTTTTTQMVPQSTTEATTTPPQTVPQSTTKHSTTTTTQMVPQSSTEATTTTTETVPLVTTEATTTPPQTVPQSTTESTIFTTTETVPLVTTEATTTPPQTVPHSTSEHSTTTTTRTVTLSTIKDTTTTIQTVSQSTNKPTITTEAVPQATIKATTTPPQTVPASTTEPLTFTTTETVPPSTTKPTTTTTKSVPQSTTDATTTPPPTVPQSTTERTTTQILPYFTTKPNTTPSETPSQSTTKPITTTPQTVPQFTPMATTTTQTVRTHSTTMPITSITTIKDIVPQSSTEVTATPPQAAPQSTTQPTTTSRTQSMPHSTTKAATTQQQTAPKPTPESTTTTSTQTVLQSTSKPTTTITASTDIMPQSTTEATTSPPQTAPQSTAEPRITITQTVPQTNTEPTTTITTQRMPHSTTQANTIPRQPVLKSTTEIPTTTPQTVPQSTQKATITRPQTAPNSSNEHTTTNITTQTVPQSTTERTTMTITETVSQFTDETTATPPQTVPQSITMPTTTSTTETVPQSTTEATATPPQTVPQSTTEATTTPPQTVPQSITMPTTTSTTETVSQSTTEATTTPPQTAPQSTPEQTTTITETVPQSTTEETATPLQPVSQSISRATTTRQETSSLSTTDSTSTTTKQTVPHSTTKHTTTTTHTVSQFTVKPTTTTQTVLQSTTEPTTTSTTQSMSYFTTKANTTPQQTTSQCTPNSTTTRPQTVPQPSHESTTTTQSVVLSTTKPTETVPLSTTEAINTQPQTVPQSTIKPTTATTAQTVPQSTTKSTTIITAQSMSQSTTQPNTTPPETVSQSITNPLQAVSPSTIQPASITATMSTTTEMTTATSLVNTTSFQLTSLGAASTISTSATRPVFSTIPSSGTISTTLDKTLANGAQTTGILLTNSWAATATPSPSCFLLESWLQSGSHYNVSEGVAIGSIIGQLPAEVCNVDGSQGPIDIDSQSGRIYVRNGGSQGQRTQYNYNISFCGCPSESHRVTVSVYANLPPKFSQKKYSLDIIEGSGQYTVVGSFPADDPDTCAQELTYELLPPSVRNHLAIGRLGVVSIRRKMYHQQLVDSGIISHRADRSFTFEISASDGTQNTTAAVQATLLSALKTTLNYTEITVYLAEGLPPGTFVANIHTTLGIARDTVLSITQQSRQDVFTVAQLSGNITTKVTFDRESRSHYTLVLEVAGIGCAADKMGLEVVVIVEDVNDNSPKFTPLSYMCYVPEDSDILQGLIIAVSDEDSGDNAMVQLSVHDALQNVLRPSKVEGSSSFNAFTVDVLQPGKLDYEMTSSLYANLTATDLGSPPRSTTTELTIHLIDVNDNPPVFINSSYFATITVSSPRTLPVLVVSATDKDTSASGVVSYYLLSGSNGIVSVTNDTGEIRLRSDVQPGQTIHFRVMAKDNGLPARSTVTDVSLVVLGDDTQNLPNIDMSFTSAFYNVIVREQSLQALTVSVDDGNNPDAGEIEYIMGQPLYGNFTKVLLNSTTGEITFSNPVDYEVVEERFFLFYVLAGTSDRSSSASTTVFIEIQDSNDELPVFTEDEYHANISLLDPPGTPVLLVRATDRDRTPVQYSLGQEFDASFFNIEPDTGLITSNLTQTPSVSPYYNFTVMASDGIHVATSSVTIYVFDREETLTYQRNISIPEDATTGTITALGVTVENVYGPSDVFQARQDVLVLLNPLDREKESTYTALLTGRFENQRSLSTLLTIDISDVNDNPPRCARPYYRLVIPAGETTALAVLSQTLPPIDISDPDLPPYNTWSASLSDYRSIFRFDHGNIELISDRKTLNSSTYEFHLHLQDDGDPRLSSVCWLHVEVMDVSSLYFSDLPSRLSLSEHLPLGAVVLTLNATSLDDRTMGQYSYSVSTNTSDAYLSVDELSGEVTINKSLDFETDPTFVLRVEAFHHQLSSTTSATVSILVADYNDNGPVFGHTEYYKEIRNNPNIGDVMITVSATDDDKGPEGDVTYGIEGCGQSFFKINDVTGDIILAKALELVYYPNISLVVTATDGGHYARVSRALVLLTIPNFNPTGPVFLQAESLYSNITVLEEIQVGGIFTVSATDYEGDDIEYTLHASHYKDYLEIGPLSGEIKAVKPLDREQIARDFYQNRSQLSRRRRQAETIAFCRQEDADVIPLIVQATDTGLPPRTSRICIRIIVLDINDHRPVFNTSEVTVIFRQTFQEGVFETLPLTAVDEDEGAFGKVFYVISSRTTHFEIENRNNGAVIKASRDCEGCVQTKDYEFEKVTVYAYNKDEEFDEFKNKSQLLTVRVVLTCGDRCGLSKIEIILIPLCCLLAIVVILLILMFAHQYKRHKLYKEGTDRKNLEKLRDAQRTHFQPRDETYNQPDEEESGFPITQISRDSYLTPQHGSSGQTTGLYLGGLRSDEGYRSQESDMDYFFQPLVSRGVPRMENFPSNRRDAREYIEPLSPSGYSNRVATR